MNSLYVFDKQLGTRYVIGADEAGRGALAGPITAAAVLYDLTLLDATVLASVNDSKKLTHQKRVSLVPLIEKAAVNFCVVHKTSVEIDAGGLQRANLGALTEAISGVCPLGSDVSILVDGYSLPDCPDAVRMIRGDGTSLAIASASILAKVGRDLLMEEYAKKYPEYGFERHRGYGSKFHRDAMKNYGLTPIHRTSFTLKNT